MKRQLSTLVLSLTLASSLSAASTSFGIPAAGATTLTGNMVVQEAMRFLHYRYAYTGSTPKTGFSCIGLVYYVFQHLGVDMPGNLSSAMATYPRVRERDLRRGDLIFFQNTVWKGVSHVGIYIGQGRMISAENIKRGVTITALRHDPVEGSYWQRHYLTSEAPLPQLDRSVGIHRSSSASGHAVVTVSSLNLRSGHSVNATVITVLTQGTGVEIRGDWGQWAHVRLTNGIWGWLVRTGLSASSRAAGGGGQSRRASGWAKVEIDGLHMHTGPAVSDPIITSLRYHQVVRVVGHSSGWDKIAAGGRDGWSVAYGLEAAAKPKQSGRHGGSVAHRPGTTYSVLAGVNVHDGPSVAAPVVAVTDAGTRVVVREVKDGFARVRTSSGQTGWLLTRFIQHFSARGHGTLSNSHGGKKPKHGPVGKAAVLTGTAHLRTGPSLSARILGWVKVGSRVRVLRTVQGWDFVRVRPKLSGYVYGPFLSVQ